jgi:hypothetical protein
MFNFLIWSVLREEYTRSHLKNVDQDIGKAGSSCA